MPGGGAISEEGGADTAAFAVVRAITDDGDGGVDFACVRDGTGGDGVEARGEFGQHGDEVSGIVEDARVIEEEVNETTVRGVGVEVGLLLRDEETKESVALADSGVSLNHFASETGYLEMIEEGIVKGCCSDLQELHRSGAAEVELVQDLLDEAWIILGDDATGISGLVVDGGVLNREGHVQGEFAGDVEGERTLVDEGCEEGIFAIVQGGAGVCTGGDGQACGDGGGRGTGGTRSYDLIELAEEGGLPGGEREIEIDVAVNAVGDAGGTEGGEFIVEVDTELAEVLVVGVSQGEDRVGEVLVAGKVLEAELLVKGLNCVGSVALAVGAGDKDGVTLCGQGCGGIAFEREQGGDVSFGFELFGELAGDAFGGTGLRGVEYGNLERGWCFRRNCRYGGGVDTGEEPVEPGTLVIGEGCVVGDEGHECGLGRGGHVSGPHEESRMI